MARTAASARTALVYPRNPMGAVYIPGAKSIEGATGDSAITTSGWIENAKYYWYMQIFAAAISAEFDTAVTRTGTKTVKISATNATGRLKLYNSEGTALSALKFSAPIIKPSTEYTFSCYVKTTTVFGSVLFALTQFDAAAAGGTTTNTNSVTGTNDWTLLTATFTSDADAKYLFMNMAMNAGSTWDMWVDVNSMTLVETGVTRSAASARNPAV